MMTRQGLAALALAAIVLTTAAGCGGSKGLSRSELIAKANPLCRRANEALDSSKLNPSNIAQVAPAVAVTVQQVSAELAKLTPPESMASDWKVMVDSVRRAGVGLGKLAQAAKTSSLAKPSQAYIEGEKEFSSGQSDRSQIAQHNGVSECATFAVPKK